MTEPNLPEHEDTRETQNPYWLAINWNNADKEDPLSNTVWKKLTENFWLPEKIAISNDLPTWNKLTDDEKLLVMRVFTGLTMLDTIQGRFGAYSLMKDSKTLFEEAVYSNIIFMEQVHARSYSNIFSTLSNTTDITAAFRWSSENEFLLKKAETVVSYYRDQSDADGLAHLRRKIASTFLESFLFYSGFYLPLYLNANQKLPNTADIIKLIMRDESVHGWFIGAKFQEELKLVAVEEQELIKDWAYDFMYELYENEVLYTQDLYDAVGLTEDVKIYLRYNANKALQNLGLEPLFPHEDVNPVILSQLSTAGRENHDFFSGAGSSYAIAKVEALSEDDWDEFD